MDGLSRWDLVLWIIIAYVAVMAMVRMMLHYRDTVVRKLSDQMANQPSRKNVVVPENERREAA